MWRQAEPPLYRELPNLIVGELSISLESKPRVVSWEGATAFTGVAVLALLIVFLVLRHAIAIPMLDDWEMVPVVAKAHTGTLGVADLFEQQQEARTIFPKLVFIALSYGKYWDGRMEMILSVLSCCITALGIYRLLGRARLSAGTTIITFLLSVFLVFSPTQHELWLLASGFPSFVPALCLVWGIYFATSARPIISRFWICVALAALASFTLSNGLLAWGLTFPLAFAVSSGRPKMRWLGYWVVAAGICAAIYFWHFRVRQDLPAFAPQKTFFEYWRYLAAFLGAGLGRSGNEHPLAISTVIGSVLLLGYVGILLNLFFRKPGPVDAACVGPWLALGAYSIGSGCLAALGRIQWGVSQALESRYVAFSIYLAIAVIVLTAIHGQELRKASKPGTARRLFLFTIAGFLVVGCLTLELLCAIDSIAFFRVRSAAARLGQSAVLFGLALDTSATIRAVNHPRPEFVRENADALDRLRLLRTPLVRTRELAKLRQAEADGNAAAGWWDGLRTEHDGQLVAWGWAALPAKHRSADAVLLAYANERGEWIAFALSDAILSRPDVAQVLRSADQLWSGWRIGFTNQALPKGAELSAWAIDAKEAKVYRLKTKERIFHL